MSGGRSLLLTYLGILLVLAAAGYSALVLVPDVAYGQASETWYMRDTSTDVLSCGSDLNRDTSQTAGSPQSTHTLTTDVYDYWYGRTGPGEFEAGNWVVDFWTTTAGGGGPAGKVTVIVERVSAACVVQQTIVSQQLGMTKGTTQEYSTTPVNPGTVTLASGERIVIRYAQTNGARQIDLLYDNAEGGQADTQIRHPVDPVNSGCPDSTDSFGEQDLTGNCTINGATTWGNGTLTINGDITLAASLFLYNLTILFNQTVDRTHDFFAYDDLTMRASSGISTTPANDNVRWDMWTTPSGDVIDIQESTLTNGIYDFSNAVLTLQGNTIQDSDMTDNIQHMRIGSNSTVRDNYFDAIDVSQFAVMIVRQNWGETLIWGNDINYTCSGSNCMGIEVYNMHEDLTDLYPGFPVVEVAWNNLTFTSIAAGTDSNGLDFEYSKRLYAHNNTMDVVHAGQSDTVTEFILSGGTIDSIYENNTGYGKPEAGDVYTYCFYQFIYSDTNNVWRYNSCDDLLRMTMVSGSGAATWAHNTMTNVSAAGWWMCETCGAGSGSVVDHLFYNNTFTYTSSSVEMNWIQTPLTVDDNSWVTYGDGTATQWGESSTGPYHTVPGDGNFLYKAQTSIEGLIFANETDGDRRVTMSANGGDVLYTTYPNFGGSDTATLSVEGSIDKDGSLNRNDDEQGTFLWQLGRDNATIDVLASGLMYFNVSNFYTSETYDVSIWNYSDSSYENTTFTTDGSGSGAFTKTFVSGGKYNVSMASQGVGGNGWSNSAPSITDPLTTDEAGHNISYSEGFTATDVDTNQTLLWTVATNGSFLSVVSSNRTATVSGTPAFADRDSTFYVNLTVDDQGCSGDCALSDYTNYTLYVNNSLPYVTNGIASDTGLVGVAYARDFDHQDNNTDTPTWSLASDAAFLSVHVTTGWVNGTPDSTGSFYVNVTVVDYSASGGSVNYTLTVSTRGGAATGKITVTLEPVVHLAWDTIALSASAVLEEPGSPPTTEGLSYRWDLGDGSIQEGPEVTHTYSMGLWARYIVTLQVCTPNDVVCETRMTDPILLIHWPIVGLLAAGSIVATVFLGHRRIRHRVLEVSR